MHRSRSPLLLLLLISGAVADASYLDTAVVKGGSQDSPDGASSTRYPQDDYPIVIACPIDKCAGEEFCGQDLKCHPYSCENWYTLANQNFTGYDPEISTPLECNTVASGEEDTSFLNIKPYCQGGDMPIAVYHLTEECQGGIVVCPYTRPWYSDVEVNTFVQMNRKCTARPSPTTVFVCYDISPDTDLESYFADYAEATAGQENTVSCGANNARNSHFYTGIFETPSYARFSGPYSSEAFDNSLVQAAMIGSYAEVAEESDFLFCDPGCKYTEFCGRDRKCHEFNCNNFYLQGPIAYTGQGGDGEDVPGTLKCFDTNPSDGLCGEESDPSVFPLALKYECRPQTIEYSRDDDCPLPRRFQGRRFVSYNRYCTAEPNPDQVFTCYDISPETDTQTYFEDYINDVQSNPNCTEENLRYPEDATNSENRTVELGGHQYASCLHSVANDRDCSVFYGYDSSLDTLNIDRARFTMSVTLSGERTQSPDSGATKYRARKGFWAINVLSLLFWHQWGDSLVLL
jgi:hypothetical protein